MAATAFPALAHGEQRNERGHDMSTIYRQISEADVPAGIVWTVPPRNQGQMTEVAYSRGIPAGKAADMEADYGSPYMRETCADGVVLWYRAYAGPGSEESGCHA
jgi:hypothetical protein